MTVAEDFYLIRTPLLPVNFSDQLGNLSPTLFQETIREIFSDPLLQEAIYIASPVLHQELLRWQGNVPKLSMGLYRYLLRMSSRCTPYGLFAGCATGLTGENTAVVLNEPGTHTQVCRLDMNYVAELTEAITNDTFIQAQLRYFPNNSLYASGDHYRYAAYVLKNKSRHYYLTAINRSTYVEEIFAKAEGGVTLSEIAAHITSNEISADEAIEFIHEMVQQQLLVSELSLAVTGPLFFDHLLQRLQELNHTASYTNLLSSLKKTLASSSGINKYQQVHALVQTILPDTTPKDLVQTDLHLSFSANSNSINKKILSDITEQVSALIALSPGNDLSTMRDFCNAFRERYEDQEVPLLQALDAESGIGYAGGQVGHAPLLDDLQFPPSSSEDTYKKGKLQAFQLEQLLSQPDEIVLTDADLLALKTGDLTHAPYSMALMGSILAGSAADVDAGNYLFDMNGCTGPSAANLLGRFCHGDALLYSKVQACLAAEEARQSEYIFAELVHLPEARTGNILQRPHLRAYEIVYLANSTAPLEHQVPLSDLMVSVQDNRPVLRSRRLNKIVIPRLSTAHNYKQGMPTYQFLCDLQAHGYCTQIGWHWMLPVTPAFLPRVRYKQIILSKRTWNLQQDKGFAHLDLPRHIVVKEGDNELLIDRENPHSLQLLTDMLRKKDKLTVEEFLSTEENCWVENNTGGRYVHELIIPVCNAQSTITNGVTQPALAQPTRRFDIGSEWLYAKIYCGPRNAEQLLKQTLRPLLHQLSGVTDQWFYIRYTDTSHHIRLRLHGQGDFWKTALEHLYTALSGLDIVQRIQTDTYEREIERYGLITESEALFYADSECVIQLTDLLDEEEGEDWRWLLALRGIDQLLNDFSFSLPERVALLSEMQQSFFKEAGGGIPLQQQLNDLYRKEMKRIAAVLNPSLDEEQGIEEAVALLNMRSEAIRPLPLDSMKPAMRSYIHMFVNRLLVSEHRQQELVLYHFLHKYYQSKLAISNKYLTLKTSLYEKEK
jgi:lantibiotic biosynthesis protein